ECPKCRNPNAYGDQCENCGTTLSPDELINPRSTLSGNSPIKKETKNWYLPLNEYEEFLSDWILENHKTDWKANVYGQVKSWITDGLKPRAMTRDLDWGVKVPLEDASGKVLYVWFDAPIGYITATQEWAEKNNKEWEPYWKDKDTELIHFIGKDNIVFHCIIFPAMLKAHGNYILPTNVPANEFLNLENEKISTSRNWAVWAHEYLLDFPNKEDVMRYVLTANLPETKDNNFTWKDFQTKNNSELVGIFGNFINRITVLTHKYYNGIVPETDSTHNDSIVTKAKEKVDEIAKSLTQFKFREGLSELMNIARIGNKYLAEEEPWKLIKTNPEKVKSIIVNSLQIAALLRYCCEPFLPFTAKKLAHSLNLKEEFAWEELKDITLVQTNHTLNNAELLFDKIEDEQIEKQIEKLNQSKQNNQIMSETPLEETNTKPAAISENITFDDFTKLDIRLGTILEAKKVEKTDKLLQLLVDLGTDVRTIVSGIANSFNPEEIIGKQVMVLANLEPRKIRGIESKGMILLADKEDGKLTFMVPEKPTNNGNQVQ
ncbi:MAG: methionine--tRNA ligase, partial [Solirubrobacteraceae bacterium]